MPRGVYTRTKSILGLYKRRVLNGRKRLRKIILKPIKRINQNFLLEYIPLPDIVDEYYLPYIYKKMEEIESKIIQDDDGGFALIITHQGFRILLQSSDEDTIIFTRQATIGLIREMDCKGVSMEYYEECTTVEGQKKHGLYQ